MAKKIFVGNLPFNTDEQVLHDLFAGSGEVASVTVMRDQATGRPRGFAFVEMATAEAAQNAIDTLHNSSLDGRTLTVNEARPKAAGGGGGFGGGYAGAGGGNGRGRGGRRQEPRW